MYPALAVLSAASSEAEPYAALPYPAEQATPDILWVGGEGGMEADLVKRAGVPYQTIPAAGIHGVGWRSLPGNLMASVARLFEITADPGRISPRRPFLYGWLSGCSYGYCQPVPPERRITSA